MRTWIIAVVVVGGAAAAWTLYPTLSATRHGAEQAPPKAGKKGAVAVVTVPVRIAEVQQSYDALGTANANEAITITSKVTGIVRSINFTEGQTVQKGHTLVELDDREAKATLASAVADEATARANYERSAQLLPSGSAAKATVENLRTALDGAQARAEAARARLADLTIKAPFNGKLGLRRVSAGALVTSGAIITTLDDVSIIKVDFSVPETLLSRIASGAKITGRSDAFPDRIYEGTVRTVNSRIDAATRAVEVRGEFPNTEGTMQPGMLMTVRLSLAQRVGAMLVPEEAMVPIGLDQFVYVVENDRAVMKKVTIGERLGGFVEVRDGIAQDARVVVGGVQRLRDGIEIRETRGNGLAQGGQ
jgi:membrane fusion protein (multidrug efflux system)